MTARDVLFALVVVALYAAVGVALVGTDGITALSALDRTKPWTVEPAARTALTLLYYTYACMFAVFIARIFAPNGKGE